MMPVRIPTIASAGEKKSDACKLFAMETDLRNLLKAYGFEVGKAIQRLPFIKTETLRRLHGLYKKGDITTVIGTLKRNK